MKTNKINTLTSGFSNPAEDYVTRRLSLDDVIVDNPIATYFFKYKGLNVFNIKYDDVLVVDKSVDPTKENLVVATGKSLFEHMNGETIFHVVKFKDIKDFDLWGTIVCVTQEK